MQPHRDCALDDSCVLCGRCFRASSHKDHNVSFFIAQQSGGCCDCGDAEAWRGNIQCPYHPLLQEAEQPFDTYIGASDTTPRAAPRSISEVEIPPVPNYPFRVAFPPELKDNMGRTIGYALDFLLDTLDSSPDEPSVPSNEADLRLQPTADPMQKDQYCVIIWNDDKHSFDEVIQLICDTTHRDRKEATVMAHTIDDLGREIIDMNTNVTRLLEIAQVISKIEIGVTIRRAYDTFREQVVVVIIEWLLDLTRSRLGTDTLIIREVIAAELLSPRRRESNVYGSTSHIPDLSGDIANPCRIDWLFLYHTRLWKKPRISLKGVYASVLTLSHPHKIAIGLYLRNESILTAESTCR
jgi:E3 ubiquitin-protein ligase UBR1